jgi:hypothetical protein
LNTGAIIRWECLFTLIEPVDIMSLTCPKPILFRSCDLDMKNFLHMEFYVCYKHTGTVKEIGTGPTDRVR